MCKENENWDAYEASVNKVVGTIIDETAANKLDEDKLLGGVIATLVRMRLGDISVDGADICRSRGDQCYLVESCTESCIETIEGYAKDYVECKFYDKPESGWYSQEPI